MPTKQKGKKQGKGTVKSGDGFVSIDYEHSRAKLASGFTTRKDLGRVNKNAVPQVLGLHPLWGALATVGVARTRAGRLFRLVDLVQHTSSEGNRNETLAAPA